MEANKPYIHTSTPYAAPVTLTDRMMTGSLIMLKSFPENKITPVVDVTSSDCFIAIKRGTVQPRTIPFAEISNDVVASLRQQKMENKQGEIYEELLKKAEIKILDPEIFPKEKEEAVSGDAK